MKYLAWLLVLPCLSAFAYAPESASREERFANPPASARLLPIRHHRPDDRARADAEIAELVDRGYGGMVVNAPTGKRYMVATNGWGTFRHVVRSCREKGLSLWLYDEDGYPSGSARDLVLRDHPEWAASGILVAMKDGSGGANVKVPPPPGSHRRTFICPLAGDCPDLSRLRSLPVVAHGTNDVEIAFPPGADTRWRAMVVSVGPVYEGSHASCNISRRCKYPNLLMREPTAEFIRVTHGTYARELGEDLGAFTSTFTDEPSLMTYWFKPMEYVPLPWSEELAADYAAKTGRELLDDVPDLLFALAGGDSSGKRHLFWKMVADRVAGNYFGQIREWCRRSGIGSGGHLLFEEGIPGHVGLYGDFFRCLRTLDNPGMDCLTSIPKSVPWRTARLAGSAGALNGAKRVMCEASDHSQRYREPGDAKPIRYVTEDEVKGTIARLVWGGVNTLTSYYVFDQLDADAQRRINLAAGRLITLMSEGHDASDIAVLYPSDALMATYEPSRQFGGGARNAAISEKFCKATELLYKAGRPFLIVDAASLAETKVEGGELVRGDLRWRTVVLPTKRFLDSSVLDRLAEFERAGGRVLVSDQVEAALATSNAFGPLPFRIVSGDASAAKFLWAHRRTATEDIWLVVSRSASAWKGTVGCSGDAVRGEIRLYDPSRGACETVDRNRIELDLPPWGAAVLVVSEAAQEDCPDDRVRAYVRPTRIVAQTEAVKAELLLERKHGQVCEGYFGSSRGTRLVSKGKESFVILDFGKELHGGVQLGMSPSTSPGVRLRLRFGESVSEACSTVGDGRHATNDHAMRDFEIVAPAFGTLEAGNTGFRFLRIDLVSEGTAGFEFVRAVSLMRPMRPIGGFTSSDARLNRIFDTAVRTAHLCCQDYLWDGIKRDRLVWMGDAFPEMRTILAVFGAVPILQETLDFAAATTPPDKWMQTMAPYTLWWIRNLAEWYRYTGDSGSVVRHADYIRRTMDHVASRVSPTNTWDVSGFLDWPTQHDRTAVAAGMQALCVLAFEDAALLLDTIGDETAATWRRRAEAFRRERRDPHGAKSAAAMLALGGIESPRDMFERTLGRNGHQGVSTFYGYFMLEAMSAADENRRALDTVRDYWGGMLDVGATSFWENFDLAWTNGCFRIDEMPVAGKKDIHGDYGEFCYPGFRHSLCHGWASGPAAWCIRHVLGIRPLDIGCRTIEVKPILGDLEWAKGGMALPDGRAVEVDVMRRGDGSLDVKIHAPDGVSVVR